MRKIICISIFLLTITIAVNAQQIPMSQRIAATAMRLWKDSASNARWTYEQGVIFNGINEVWMQTADKKYFDFRIKLPQRVGNSYCREDMPPSSAPANDYPLMPVFFHSNSFY